MLQKSAACILNDYTAMVKIMKKEFFIQIVLPLAAGFFCTAQGGVIITPDHQSIVYEGAPFSLVSSERAILNRHTAAVYTHAESGYGDSWTNSTGLARTQTGVRIRFRTASSTIKLNFEKRSDGFVLDGFVNPSNGFTVFCNNTQIGKFSTLQFTINRPSGLTEGEYEVTLPNLWAVNFLGLELADGTTLEQVTTTDRPRYAAIGNSITHGTGQYCATSDTYPYLLAKEKGWDLHNCAVAGAMCETTRPPRSTSRRCARRRIASSGDRACSSTASARQPMSTP